MRPRLETARDQLPMLLRRHPGARSAELARLAHVSPATMLRTVREAGASVIRIGQTSTTRYFLRRPLRGGDAPIPVYAIDAKGHATQTGELHLTAPSGSLLDVAGMGWAVDKEFASGVWPDGLPYPLQDMRPQGFLGRQFAHQESATLGIPTHISDWNDDDVVHALMQRGTDTTGNLILGDTALQRWLQLKATDPSVLSVQAIAGGYAALASQASARGAAGSSAAGEFPKFTALRHLPGARTAHVIVKYTAADASKTVQRWSDLLVCEHLAMETLRTVGGIPSARSRILMMDGRTYLEVERFDRHGLFGRSALCSLETIEAALLPSTSRDWAQAAAMMRERGWITEEALHQIQVIWAYGRLIGNSDMHRGNLSFVPTPVMQLAPVYDMLPMMFAPLRGGEIPNVRFAPELPVPSQRAAWNQAILAALAFWRVGAQDQRISAGFRAQCRANLDTLSRLTAVDGSA